MCCAIILTRSVRISEDIVNQISFHTVLGNMRILSRIKVIGDLDLNPRHPIIINKYIISLTDLPLAAPGETEPPDVFLSCPQRLFLLSLLNPPLVDCGIMSSAPWLSAVMVPVRVLILI